jgi:hypothetical protein
MFNEDFNEAALEIWSEIKISDDGLCLWMTILKDFGS